MRALFMMGLVIAVILSTSTLATAQFSDASAAESTPVASLLTLQPFVPFDATAFAQQPSGPPPTPRHTGVKALAKHVVTNFKYLPSKENLLWAGAGGGLALAAHPFDDNVN